MTKANYFADLDFIDSAIKYYKKALSDSKDPYIHASIAWCYLAKGEFKIAEEYYSKAFEIDKSPYIKIGLAIAYYNTDKKEDCSRLYHQLKLIKNNLEHQELVYYSHLESLINEGGITSNSAGQL